ncbi:class I SAM-dependent methyltransferase [Hamadaea tsunoensis]|uniref:class I SAM-dependent methyltransferase n=1 Tax=Hamadaea tsunoensis TaxID=53368 RepID=UPI000419FE18|nr:class I SAM-dependent methyltransferase [Hamadaea tsunoensis]
MPDTPSSPPPPETARVAMMFDQLAAVYDMTGVEFFGPIADGLVDVLQPRPGERLLDLGCGRGAVLSRIAPFVGPALGVDISAEMVGYCRTALVGHDNVRVEVGDAQSTDPAWGVFDAVTASLVLFFLPDPPAALRNWRNLLTPGGRCVISTFGAPGPAWQAIDETFAPFLPPGMLDARTKGPLSPSSPDAAVDALFAAAGFEDVRTVTLPLETRFASVEQWEAFSWTTGQRAMWLAVPESRRAAVRETIFEILRSSPHPDGGYVLSQSVRYTYAGNAGA